MNSKTVVKLGERICALLIFFSHNDQKAQAQKASNLAKIVKQVAPGVVNIRTRDKDTKKSLNIQSQNPSEMIDKFFLRMMMPKNLFADTRSRSLGSGFLIDQNGYIVTNYHVVENAENIEIQTKSNEFYANAKIFSFDKETDLAILKIDKKYMEQLGLIFLKFGNSSRAEVGEPVFAIGNPFGFGHSVSAGIISAKDRSIGIGPLDQFMQTDAPINPGNSGGPLFNMKGEIIGVNTAIQSEGYGISFALPSNLVANKVTKLKSSPKSNTSFYLGIEGSALNTDPSDGQNSAVYGVLVDKIISNSPAEKSGIQAGDILLTMNGKKLKDAENLKSVLQEVKGSQDRTIRLKRGVLILDTRVKLLLLGSDGRSWTGAKIDSENRPTNNENTKPENSRNQSSSESHIQMAQNPSIIL